MMSDLDAPTGIIHACVAGLIAIVLVLVATYLIASVVQAEEHVVFEPTPKPWLTP
jgi:hypothetical protein